MTHSVKQKIIVIAGPTASGKSHLAVSLAQRLNGIVINADSLQLFNALPLLTARPSAQDLQKVPHRLYAILSANEKSTAAWWTEQAILEINIALSQGKQPILVGGTGLYLEALMKGLAFIPPISDDTRRQTADDFAEMGRASFYQRLIKADPLSQHLKPADTQRILRAWEVWHATRRSLFSWHQDPIKPPTDFDFYRLALLPPRALLYYACNQRFLGMLENGAVAEVKAFLEQGQDLSMVSQALGFKQIMQYLQEDISYEEAIALAQASTRHYAKRQVTWFRHRFTQDPECYIIQQTIEERQKTAGFLDEIVSSL